MLPPTLQLLAGLANLRELKLQPAFVATTDTMEDHSLLSLTQLRRLGIRCEGYAAVAPACDMLGPALWSRCTARHSCCPSIA